MRTLTEAESEYYLLYFTSGLPYGIIATIYLQREFVQLTNYGTIILRADCGVRNTVRVLFRVGNGVFMC